MEDAWAWESRFQAQFLYRCDDFLPSRWFDLDRDFLLRSRDLDRLPRRRLLLEIYDLDLRVRSLERLRDLSLRSPRDLERDPLRFAVVTRDDLLCDRLFLRLSLERDRDFLLRDRDLDERHFLRSSADGDLEWPRQLRERDLARFRSRDRVRRFLLDLRSLEEREDRER